MQTHANNVCRVHNVEVINHKIQFVLTSSNFLWFPDHFAQVEFVRFLGNNLRVILCVCVGRVRDR